MNDASNVPIAGVLDAQTEPDSELGSGSRSRALCRRGPRRRLRYRPADRRHARLFCRQLGAFWLAGGEPGDAGLRPGERGDDRRQGLVRSQLASGRDRFTRSVRAACRRRQPLRSASRLQCDLPRFRSGAEVEAAGDLPGGADAIPGGRVFPWMRLSEKQPHFRPRLLRGPRRGRTLRPGVPAGDVRVYARQFDRRAIGALVPGLFGLGIRPRRARGAHSISHRRASSLSPAISFCRKPLA